MSSSSGHTRGKSAAFQRGASTLISTITAEPSLPVGSEPGGVGSTREAWPPSGDTACRPEVRLRDLGWVLEVPDRGGKPIGRPHVGQAVWNEPANRARLQEEGLEDFSFGNGESGTTFGDELADLANAPLDDGGSSSDDS